VSFPETEYHVRFFDEEEFVRRRCRVCGAFFWTQRREQETCGEAPCQEYTFIGSPPTSRRYALPEMREAFLRFFEDRGHARIRPYPVVARWREDLYVTIASIAAFQPFVTDGTIPPPANPLVISQPCLRFVDIDNVGLTAGRHLTIFEMGGHHAFNYPDQEIYWKDETVRAHHEFVTRTLGVHSDAVTYKEGSWSGGGNAGPDLEGIVGGLEVSTLVFMQFKVVDGALVPMPIRVVDTGYGVERYSWLSQGTPTGFQPIYGWLVDKVAGMAGVGEVDAKLLAESARLSALMNVETVSDRMALRGRVAGRLGVKADELDRILLPLESVYGVLDHTKALSFMLAESVVPSNVGVGYLTRALLRRTMRLLRLLKIEERLIDIVELQIGFWSKDFPYLTEMRGEILRAVEVEERKYRSTLQRGASLVRSTVNELRSKGQSAIPVSSLIELYDSQGMPPEIVKELSEKSGMAVAIPDNFYSMVTDRHVSAPPQATAPLEEKLGERLKSLPETEPLYYSDPRLRSFKGRVLWAEDEYVVLDRTAFYPEGGGQPGDHGRMVSTREAAEVADAKKVGRVVVHVTKGVPPKAGEEVTCELDWDRRISLMRHHTATHIITGACRRVLGEHAWQAGAQKGPDRSRLDISHWERLSGEQLNEIERLSNDVVLKNMPVTQEWMRRDAAETKYGFRLYQGGVVPGREIRVIKTGDWDVEACGGVHCASTGEVGFVKIIGSERIQDGVERLHFMAGMPAVLLVQARERMLSSVAAAIKVPLEGVEESVRSLVEEWRSARRELERLSERLSARDAKDLLEAGETLRGMKVVAKTFKEVGIDYLISVANQSVKMNPRAVIMLCSLEATAKFVVMAGRDAVAAGVDSSALAAEAARVLGGGGSGKREFGQGGGPRLDRVEEALSTVRRVVERQLGGRG